MTQIPRLSKKEYLILDMLIERGELYGLEMVKASRGELKRGTVYVTLSRMVEKGFVESNEVKEENDPGLPRRVFRPTGHGFRIYDAVQMMRSSAIQESAV